VGRRLAGWQHDGLTFDVRDTGPLDGEVVVCLHGFPQDGTAYDEVAERLASDGFRVLVPDQRGYSPGARPAGDAAYGLRQLSADVVSLLDAVGVDRAHVVGHDWGGAVAWALGSRHAARVRSLVVLSTPHPHALRAAVLSSTQALRSAYIGLFQLPVAPELLMTVAGGLATRTVLEATGLSRQRAAHYAARLTEAGAAAAALGWYRALRSRQPGALGRVHAPTTYLVGRRDPFFSATAVRLTAGAMTGPFREEQLDAGHWLPENEPAAVADAVTKQAAQVRPGR
jgi:pimeloyl-ACP methyl ester carboxylesterase